MQNSALCECKTLHIFEYKYILSLGFSARPCVHCYGYYSKYILYVIRLHATGTASLQR